MPDQPNIEQLLKERFHKLPAPVQRAIQSADIEKQLRALAENHKLHVDQWQSLENEVMLALLGFRKVAELAYHLEKSVRTDANTAAELAASISDIVFEPVREELERQLEHPEAKEQQVSGVEQARRAALAQETSAASQAPAAVAPATPPAPRPQAQILRAPISETYKPGQASTERAGVHDDPYREAPV